MSPKLLLFFCAALLLPTARTTPSYAQMKFNAGFSERVRHEYWKNNRDMNTQSIDGGERNFFRFKTSLWGQADYEELLSLFARVTNEIKSYTYYGNAQKTLRGDSDEWVIDNLYLDVVKPGGFPVNFRVGRQDLINQYGENFLIVDGTPGDGSRTFYFNAAKASWNVDDKNTLDLIYLYDPRTDQLAIINENQPATALELSDEAGFIAYLKNRSIAGLSLEPYYIYKREGGGGGGLQSLPGKIHTYGVFTKCAAAPWTFHFQLAGQSGEYGNDDRKALGGYGFVDYEFKEVPSSPVLTGGLVYLSGDDKSTAKNEGWNPLFTRFPLWSEIYAQAYQGESGNSYWTNLMMYRTQLALKLTGKARLTLIYSFLRALEQPVVTAATTAAYSFSGEGKNRGSLYQGKIDYAFNKNVSAYILGELFDPGNFYVDEADKAIFVRTQVEIKF